MKVAFDFDLFVIGGGSGGVRAARLAAQGGARVGIAEEYRFGGTCVVRGCVPKKLMVYASGFRDMFEEAEAFGWSVGPRSFDWKRFIATKDIEIIRLETVYRQAVDKAGAKVFPVRATVSGPHEVRLAGGETFRTKHILVATGGHPLRPEFPGADLAVTSNEMFQLPDLPTRALVLGSGFIACEFACILHGMGSQVTQVARAAQVLRGFDGDVREHLGAALISRGIDLRTGGNVAAIARKDGALEATLADGSRVMADCVLVATGRAPNTAGLGLAEAGVKLGARGEVAVDQWSQSNVPSIFAVGDVTDRIALTPVAIREASAFVETVFRGNPVPMDHADVASAVFTRPEIGTVGLSEETARARGEVVIYKTAFRPMVTQFAGKRDKMLMKLVVDAASRRVLGCHIVGPNAAEMIQMAAIAVKMRATKEDFDRTVAVHPTAAEELVTMRESSDRGAGTPT